ncbi:MAG: DMT family transporter [Acidimicrobiia bacterium]|nr:DMT family transporter [Acidimicrobiia bacterium]
MFYWLYRGDRTRTISGSNTWLVVALGVLLYTAVPAMQFIGLDQTDAVSFNFVFQAGIPLMLALTAGMILKESTTWWEWVGVSVVVLGAWVFFPARPMGADGRGVFLAGVAAVIIGTSNLIQRQILRKEGTSALEVTTVSMSIGAVILAVFAVLVDNAPSLDLRLVFLLLVLGVLNTAVAFFIWHRAIKTLRALHIGVIASTQLVFVPLLSMWFLDEPFGWRRALGSLIVLAGIAVVHYSIAWAKEHRVPAPQ